jgi:hypothetical protein
LGVGSRDPILWVCSTSSAFFKAVIQKSALILCPLVCVDDDPVGTTCYETWCSS